MEGDVAAVADGDDDLDDDANLGIPLISGRREIRLAELPAERRVETLLFVHYCQSHSISRECQVAKAVLAVGAACPCHVRDKVWLLSCQDCRPTQPGPPFWLPRSLLV